ncbi:MAG: haloacid dehalogenase type II [Phycisphaerales bacterium]
MEIKALTFDCFGTLIDWETGILRALTMLCERYGIDEPPPRGELLALYAQLEAQAEHGEYRPYKDVLADVTKGVAARLGFQLSLADQTLLADSMKDWPAFDDTAGSLRELKKHYKLGVLSNVDDDLFEGVQPRLGLQSVGGLDLLVTAQQVRSYKPGHAHFKEALSQLEIEKDELLHVAQSKRHDVAPCNELGIRCVWVDRQAGGGGASGEYDARPDMVVPDLASLVRELVTG